MKKDILLMTISELLFSMAEGSIVVFGIIFFYQKFNSILLAIAPFVLLHLFHAFLLPLLYKVLFKIGFKTSIVLGSIFYIATSVLIFLTNGKYTFEILVVWSLLYALGNVFHYVPIIYTLGSQSTHSGRGRLFGLRRIIFISAAIVTPVIGGFISERFGFQGLIATCIAFYLLSNIPIMYMNKIEAKRPKSLVNSLMTFRGKKILLYKISEVFTNNMGDFWPIYVFIILAGSFSEMGILFSIISFISILITYFTGKALDKRSRKNMYFAASITTLVSWIFRALSFNYISILAADTVFKISGNFKMQVAEVIDYDLTNDHINDARASVIIISETIVNYMIAFVEFAGALAIMVFGFQAGFIIFGIFGFIFAQIMRLFLNKK